MDLQLSEFQELLRSNAEDFLIREVPASRIREIQDAGEPDAKLWAKIVELGWTGLPIAEEHGGQGGSILDLSIVIEQLCRTALLSPFVPTALAALVVQQHGTSEAQQLLQEIDNTAQNTEFNGLRPLDGSAGTITLDGEGDLDIQFSESTVDSLGLNGLDISTQAGASAALATTDAAADQINQNRSSLGAQENGLAVAADERSIRSLNLREAESRIRDLEVARAFVEQTRNQVLLQSGISALAQANLQNETAASLLGG